MSDPWGASTSTSSASSSSPSVKPDDDDLLLGTVAGILDQLGDRQGYAILVDSRLRTEYEREDWGVRSFTAHLFVERHLLDALTEERKEVILRGLNDAVALEQRDFPGLEVHPLIHRAAPTWRDEAARRLEAKTPRNQATIGRTTGLLTEDRLLFRSREELAVYRALKHAASKLPDTDALGIMPGAGFRTATGNIFEPDFVVTYHGGVAVIEVDGPLHGGKAANDHSRDRLIQRSGVAFVERIPVADTDKPAELARFVAGFLDRLGRA